MLLPGWGSGRIGTSKLGGGAAGAGGGGGGGKGIVEAPAEEKIQSEAEQPAC